MSITNVAKRASVARSTVYKIIQKYIKNDGVISSIPEKQERRKMIEKSVVVGNH
jgi:transposase